MLSEFFSSNRYNFSASETATAAPTSEVSTQAVAESEQKNMASLVKAATKTQVALEFEPSANLLVPATSPEQVLFKCPMKACAETN